MIILKTATLDAKGVLQANYNIVELPSWRRDVGRRRKVPEANDRQVMCRQEGR